MMHDEKEKKPTGKTKTKITSLVFQGGGIKGTAYVGALQELKNHIDYNEVVRIAGTSAGAIIATLLSVDYSIDEISNLLQKMSFVDFMDEAGSSTKGSVLDMQRSPGFSSSISGSPAASTISHRLRLCFGIYEGEFFRKWIEECIFKKTKREHLTFEELHELRRSNSQYKDLYVVGFNVNTGLAETFSHETTGRLIISDAVRISMSIPFIFKPHGLWYKQKVGTKFMRVADGGMHLYVDGGMTDNYPVNLFDRTKYCNPVAEKKDEVVFNNTTLGFRLVQKKQKDFLEGVGDAPEKKTESILPYFQAVLTGVYRKQESDHVRGQDQVRTVYIDTKDVGTLDFDISKERSDAIIESGREGVRSYFDQQWRNMWLEARQKAFPFKDDKDELAVHTDAIMTNPGLISAYYRRAFVSYHAGDFKTAINDCKTILSKIPEGFVYNQTAKAILDLTEQKKKAQERRVQTTPLLSGFFKSASGDKTISHIIESIESYCDEVVDEKDAGFVFLK